MINLDDLPMRVGLGQFQEITTSRLQFIKQCGCDDFQMNTPDLPGPQRWEYEDLAHLVQQATEAQLRLIAIENVPTRFYDRIMLGADGREKQLDNMATRFGTLRGPASRSSGTLSCRPACGERPETRRSMSLRPQGSRSTATSGRH